MFRPNAQLPLLDWSFEPIRRDRAHYVPMLLDMPGELMALEHADSTTWDWMTPLVQVVPRIPKAGQKPGWVVSRARRIAQAVGYRPFYLDASGAVLGRQGRGGWPEEVVAEFFDHCRRETLAFVPVHIVGRRDLAGVVGAAADQDGRGVAVRYLARSTTAIGSMSLAETLASELSLLDLSTAQADLIIDFGYAEPRLWPTNDELSWIIAQAGKVGAWRNVILAATSIPRSLGLIQQGSLGGIPRREIELWRDAQVGSLGRLVFADYGIQSPRAPDTGRAGKMRANVRYSTESMTLVARAIGAHYDLLPPERATQYRELCSWLVGHPLFSGRDFSWGDGVIEDGAAGAFDGSTQNLWRGAGMSHHLQVTVDSLRRISAAEEKPTPVVRLGESRGSSSRVPSNSRSRGTLSWATAATPAVRPPASDRRARR
jgi:hypothetical protein